MQAKMLQNRGNVCSCSYQLSGAPSSVRKATRAPRRSMLVARATEAVGGDAEDDLSAEFENVSRKADPEKFSRLAQHLDLLWRVSERRLQKPESCEPCRGSGLIECTWCHGTGALTVGDTLFCSSEGCKTCPVCHGTGDCTCEKCRGAGKVASWLHPAPPSQRPRK